jgi:hypothetical protein
VHSGLLGQGGGGHAASRPERELRVDGIPDCGEAREQSRDERSLLGDRLRIRMSLVSVEPDQFHLRMPGDGSGRGDRLIRGPRAFATKAGVDRQQNRHSQVALARTCPSASA